MSQQKVLNSVAAAIVAVTFSGNLFAGNQTSKATATSKSTANGQMLNNGQVFNNVQVFNNGLDAQQLLKELQAKAGNAQSSQAFEGVINVNGREIRTNDPQQFQRLRQQLMQRFSQFPMIPQGFGQKASAFSGVINNNGQVQKFTNPEAFQQAQQQLLFK